MIKEGRLASCSIFSQHVASGPTVNKKFCGCCFEYNYNRDGTSPSREDLSKSSSS